MDTLKGIGYFAAIIGIIYFSSTNFFRSTESKPSSLYKTDYSEYDRDDDFSTERSYEDYGDMDCSDFSSQEEAQQFFEDEGGPDEDYHNLDRDGDGYVCESL